MPLLKVNINKGIWHTLEEHLRAYLCHSVNAHTARDLVLAGCKGTHTLCKGLRLQVLHIPFGEGVDGAQANGIECGDAFAQDEVVRTYEAVFLTEDGLHVFIELKREQDNEHAQQVGKEEACQLGWTDVSAKEFPNKSHSFNILS